VLSDELLQHIGARNGSFVAPTTKEGTKALRSRIEEFLGPVPDLSKPPLRFREVPYAVFLNYLLGLTKKDKASGEQVPLSLNSLRTHRTALSNLFSDFGIKMEDMLDIKIRAFFRAMGLKQARDAKAAGERATHMTGKLPLSYVLFKWLLAWLLRSVKAEFVFLRTALITQFTLMSRADNSLSVSTEFLCLIDDSLGIAFAASKTDGAGAFAGIFRHCYANPYQPETCFVLALAEYLLVYPMPPGSRFIFGSLDPYERFRKALSGLSREAEVVDHFREAGYAFTDLGTHSFRKTSVTHARSIPGCPAHAVALRRNVSDNPGDDTYAGWVDESDMFVGRLLAGLFPDTVEFTVSPPFFELPAGTAASPEGNATMHLFKETAKALFSEVNADVAFLLLASAVHHASWIVASLPACHPMRNTRLFLTPGLVERLQPCTRVATLLPAEHPFHATGVPPGMLHLLRFQVESRSIQAAIQTSLQEVRGQLAEVLTKLSVPAAPSAPSSGLTPSPGVSPEPALPSQQVLIDCARVGAGFALEHFMALQPQNAHAAGEHQTPDVPRHEPESAAAAAPGGPQVPEASVPDPQGSLGCSGGRLRRLPAQLTCVPKVALLTGWQLYCCGGRISCGSQTVSCPPLFDEHLTSTDLNGSRDAKRRFGEFKFVYGAMKQALIRAGKWGGVQGALTPQRANALFYDALSLLPLLQAAKVDAWVVEVDAHVRAVGRLLVQLGGIDECLRRNTAHVQTNTTWGVLFHHQDFLAELS